MPIPIENLLRAAEEAEASGDLDAAIRHWRIAASSPDAPAEPWYRLGRLQADLGQAEEAVASLKGALHRDPTHIASLELLVELGAMGVHPDEVLECVQAAEQHGVPDAILRSFRASLRRASGEPLPPSDLLPEPPDLEILPDDADLVRFMAFFGGREDVYARQWYAPAKDRGGYSPVHEPLTPSVLRRHFLGEVTLGVYPVRLDGTCVFAALDLDIPASVLDAARADPGLARRVAMRLQEATAAARGLLRDLGFLVVVEDSGYKGRHLWLLFDSPVPARLLRELCDPVLQAVRALVDRDLLEVEFFPKQAELRGKGLGNLIKLPLGIHRRSGRRSTFLDEDLTPIRRPFTYLRALARAPATAPMQAIEELRKRGVRAEAAASAETETSQGLREPASAEPEPVDLLPEPPAPPPAWTEADFDADPDVRHLLSACPVIAEATRQALEHGTLSREARLVLRHTLGHFPSGLLAYNFLHDRTGGAEPERLVSVLKGNPVSCAKVRSRLPEVVARVPCACEFPWAEGTYANPVLHLQDPARPPAATASREDAGSAPPEDLPTEVRRFAQLVRRLRELEQERDQFARRLAMWLRALPDAAVELIEGRMSLEVEGGVEVLKWTPCESSEPAEAAAAPIPLPAPAFCVVANARKETGS